MRNMIILVMCCLFFATSLAEGATRQNPAYRKVEISGRYPSGAGLEIQFALDEQACKKAYGKNWRVKCAASMGNPGETASGVKISPQEDGYWEWTSPTTLIFNARKVMKPETVYTLDLTGLGHRDFVKLDTNRPAYKSWPLAVQLLGKDLLLDPSPAGAHQLLCSMNFNYSVPENFSLPVPRVPQDMNLGAPVPVWNEKRDLLHISWPVKSLPKDPGAVMIDIPVKAQVVEKDGEFTIIDSGKVIFQQNVPGKADIFTIRSISTELDLDDNLDQTCLVHIETSLYTDPEDLIKSMTVLQLPRNHSKEGLERYDWRAAPAIPRDILKQAKRLEPQPASGSALPRTAFSWRIMPEAGSYIIVAIDDKLKSASGVSIKRPIARVLATPENSANLGFLQPGHVLSMRKDASLDLYAANIDRIKWEIQSVRDPFLALLAAGNQQIFEQENLYNVASPELISAVRSGVLELASSAPGKACFASLDAAAILDEIKKSDKNATGLFRISLTGMKGEEPRAYASRLLLASSLGAMLKITQTGAYECFILDTDTGLPASNVKVAALAANGKTLAEVFTSERGYASLPSLKGLKRESRPVALLATDKDSLVWLPIEDKARELNYSGFDTGGAKNFANDLNVFVFGQRGIYRPGEKLHFGAIVRKSDFSPIDADHTLWAEITDPRGMKIWERTFTCEDGGIADLAWQSGESNLSGTYILNIRTGKDGDILQSQTARIEDFLPDTLKLKLETPVFTGWLVPAEIPGVITARLQNLYGTPAAGNKLKTAVSIRPARFNFKKYADYVFSDPAPLSGEGQQRDLADAMTDGEGNAKIAIPGDYGQLASAVVTFFVQGFEKSGGRAVSASTAILVSPHDKIIGYKSPANLRFIPQGSAASVKLIAIDSQLNRVAWDNLDFTIGARELRTALISDGSGGFKYDETPVVTPIKNWKASLDQKGMAASLITSDPGEYVLTVRNGERLLAEIPYAVSGHRLAPAGTGANPANLRLRLNRDHYKPGDTIQVALSSPYAGAGLLTLERDGVEAFEWFKAPAGDSIQTIRIPDNFEGKGYVAVSLVKGHDPASAYMTPHSFAVAPFIARAKERGLDLKLDAPARTASGAGIPLRIKSARKARALVYAIDEGIGLLTQYKAPEPLKALFEDRALNVRSLQIHDLLMPVNLKLRQGGSAFGGGMDALAYGPKFNNPFKRKNEPPLTWWQGIIEIGQEPLELIIPAPEYYNGNVKIYAVACSETGVDSAATECLVNSQVALFPNLPLAVAPGDSFEASLTVANTTTEDLTLNLKADFGPALEIVSKMPEIIKVGANSEILVPFSLKASGEPAGVEVKFTASDGKMGYSRSQGLSIRPLTPYRTTLAGGRGDMPLEVSPRKVFEMGAKTVATISTLPLPLINGFARYFETYPHGCTEQLVSRAFTQLFTRNWMNAKQRQDFQKQLDAALNAIRTRFNGQGVSLWQNSPPDLLLTIYAADFLLSLRGEGLYTDEDLLNQLCLVIRNRCSLDESSLEAARTIGYAIWVLTRAGEITTQLLENFMEALAYRQVEGWQRDLVCVFIAASQKEMRMRGTLPCREIDYNGSGWFDEYAQQAFHTFIMNRYFSSDLDEKAKNDFYEASFAAMGNGGFSTFSAANGARTLLALSAGAVPSLQEARIGCADGQGGEYQLIAGARMLEYTIPLCEKIRIETPNNDAPIFYQVAVGGYDVAQPAENEWHGIEISKTFKNNQGQETKEFQHGDEITVEVEARGHAALISDCVISDLLPGGTEMILSHKPDFPANMKFINRREDRVDLFTDLGSEPIKFTYKIRAVNRGVFAIPAISAMAMYDQGKYGSGTGGKLIIK